MKNHQRLLFVLLRKRRRLDQPECRRSSCAVQTRMFASTAKINNDNKKKSNHHRKRKPLSSFTTSTTMTNRDVARRLIDPNRSTSSSLAPFIAWNGHEIPSFRTGMPIIPIMQKLLRPPRMNEQVQVPLLLQEQLPLLSEKRTIVAWMLVGGVGISLLHSFPERSLPFIVNL
jgi:hypothetical protein